jgi:oxygen-independent coproporphyrinogen-3 oxidase
VSQKHRAGFVKALIKETELQKEFFSAGEENQNFAIDTLYFGGGTPSLLHTDELESIVKALDQNFAFKDNAEVTLEANPDDLSPEKLYAFRNLGINRLSIGIQSFHESDLRYMNRSHTSEQATKVLEDAQRAGFTNITADLIYGTPGMSDLQWHENIMKLIDLGIPHISAYSLTVEKQTALHLFIKKGKAAPVDEEQAARQFEILSQLTRVHGFVHYEISNFGRPGNFSQHNLGYWSGEPYLGMGPSAHSFLPGQRQWNVANTVKYIDSLSKGNIPSEKEILSKNDQYNEYVMTSLRTLWGAEKKWVQNRFGDKYLEYMMAQAQRHLKSEMLTESDTHLFVTTKGRFFSDGIASDIFME